MAFTSFIKEPLSLATSGQENDYFVGDGLASSFLLTKKPFTSVANTTQVGTGFLFRHTGAVTGSGQTLNLLSPPAVGDKITVPGVTRMLLKAYDQDPIPGVVNPRIYEAAFHFGDILDITFTQYEKNIALAGIKVQVVDKDTSFGATTSMIQLAQALPDGTAGTYLAAGSPVFISYDIVGFTTVNAVQPALTQALTVADGTEIPTAGCWIIINPGGPNQDIVWVTAVAGNLLTLREFLTYSHVIGENVFVCACTVWAKLTVPLNFTGGIPTNLYDDAIDVTFDAVQRN